VGKAVAAGDGNAVCGGAVGAEGITSSWEETDAVASASVAKGIDTAAGLFGEGRTAAAAVVRTEEEIDAATGAVAEEEIAEAAFVAGEGGSCRLALV
jgi:hypothetical protein